jgi:tetratricopeptide (TPR) repeat protein
MALERQGDYDAALTSYRLALRDRPNDTKILQNMAIAFTKTNRPEEAIRTYKHALDLAPNLSGAHYGLAFLLLKRGDRDGAQQHLQEFLARAPRSAEAQRWVEHATTTLERLRSEPAADGATAEEGGDWPDGGPRG